MSERSAAEPVRFRPYWTCWMAIAVAVVLLGVSVFAAVRLQHSATGSDFGLSDQVAMAGLGLVLALAALLPVRPLVRADADGVSVRNMFFSRRFEWQEIGGVSFPDGAVFPRLELPADEYYAVQAIQVLDRRRAVAAVRTLRQMHRAALRRTAVSSAADAAEDSAADAGEDSAADAGEDSAADTAENSPASDNDVSATEDTEATRDSAASGEAEVTGDSDVASGAGSGQGTTST